jgi:formamidopyrimidine-DNA glycosylase
MPELPEVETVRLGVEKALVGLGIEKVTVTGRRSVRRQPIADFIAALEGRRLVGARRRGKYLLVDLDDASVLVIHLRMSGQLLHVLADTPLLAHTHVVLRLDDGSELRFVDPRTFGEMFVVHELDNRDAPFELASIGRDPIVDGVDCEGLRARLGRRHVALKTFLLDQRELAGIGNIYADEICFAAKLRPTRFTNTLGPAEVRRLCAAIEGVLREAVTLGGSTLRDTRYRDLFGGLGSFQTRHAAYDRGGEPCLRCPGTIRRVRIGGRSSYFCPRCQR